MKKYHLTTGEKDNLLGRRKTLDYLQHLINSDIGMFVYTSVLPRLKLPSDTKFAISEDGAWIEVEEETNGTVTKSG